MFFFFLFFFLSCRLVGKHPASGVRQSAMRCDFESDDLCGWVQDTTTDEFDWTWQNYGTPSSHLSTGPSFDHTLGPGKGGQFPVCFFFRFLSSNDLPMWRQSQEPMMGEEGGNCWERAAISLPARQRYKRIGILEKESRGSRGIASSIGFGCEMDGIGKRESAGLAG